MARKVEKTIKGKFEPSKTAERDFFRALKKVAQLSGHLVDSHVEGHTIKNTVEMQKALAAYADLITPWARRVSARMLEKIMKQNERAYNAKSKIIGAALKLQVADREVGATAAALMNEQVQLIRSIPLEAGLRAQKIAFESVLTGTRAAPDQDTIAEIQKQLGLSTEVAVSRAQLIARTETARATASINQARAMKVGSGQYRWHNSGDGAVRDSHRIYEGKPMQGCVFSWNDPPTLSDGMTGHPGTFPNCRCFAEPIFTKE